jgi:hypothetical protein
MHFQEITEGEYRIYVGALESPVGDGYTAALVVQHGHGGRGRDAFSDDRLSCGHRWASADDAMSFALRKGRELVRSMRAVAA